MPRTGMASLAARASLAVALMIGFYVLALGLAGLLAFVPYAEYVYGQRLHIKVALLCLGGAAVILWSIVPRWDRFEAPGALLTADAQPGLFASIDKVAAAAQQARPSEVYLVRDMNAWVSSRGGVMGVGSRRIMGIGLPLLQHLTVSQLHGVLAHEFGHYHGGDVKLGPWIYKTRAAIGRTVETLARSGSSVIHKPFVWYGNLFLRVTHAISRNQELNADGLSARIVGRQAFITGLKAVHGGSAAFDAYWGSEVAPVLNAGYRPPLARGFSQFLSARSLEGKIESLVAAAMQNDETDPYDTHPSTRERIARVEAIADLPPPLLPPDDGPAIALMRELEAAELALLKAIARDPEAMASLKPIDWERVGEGVWLESWRRAMVSAAAVLGTMTPATAPTTERELEQLGRKILGDDDVIGVPAEALVARAASVIAAGTCCLLVGAGWTVDAMPGEPVVLRRGGSELRPFEVMMNLARGETPDNDWAQLHSTAGISDQRLTAG